MIKYFRELGDGNSMLGAQLFILALLFAWALLVKILNPHPTIEILESVWNIQQPRLLFILLVVAEAAMVSLILSGINPLLAAALSIILLSIFSVSIMIQIHQGNNLSCGCGLDFSIFNMSARQSQWYALGRNFLFIILLVAACLPRVWKPLSRI